MVSGRGSLVVKVSNACPMCHEFESSTAEGVGGGCTINLSRDQTSSLGFMWKLGEAIFCFMDAEIEKFNIGGRNIGLDFIKTVQFRMGGRGSLVVKPKRGTRSKDSLKNAWNKLWPDLEGEKDFNGDHREEITDFVQSIRGFQECDEEDVETWMACDAEDCGFQMLNDDEIVTSCKKYPTLWTMKMMKTRTTTTTEVARIHQMLKRFLR
ncbi:UNVERIFIED_CONTAM: hypothetical protein NCL1_21573 [Trichonephila clavipes]